MSTKKDFSKNRSWISSLTMKSKILPDWKMAFDELLEGLFRQQYLRELWVGANEPRDVIYFQLICFHIQGLFKLSALGSRLRSWLWLPVTHLLLQGRITLRETLPAAPPQHHFLQKSWSENRRSKSKLWYWSDHSNSGTGLCVYRHYEAKHQRKRSLKHSWSCKHFQVGPIFSIPLCLFSVGPATVSYKTYKCPYWHPQDLFSDCLPNIYGQSCASPLLPFEQTSKYLLLK